MKHKPSPPPYTSPGSGKCTKHRSQRRCRNRSVRQPSPLPRILSHFAILPPPPTISHGSQEFWTKFLEARRLNAGVGGGSSSGAAPSGVDFTGKEDAATGVRGGVSKSMHSVRKDLDLTTLETHELLSSRGSKKKEGGEVLWLVNRASSQAADGWCGGGGGGEGEVGWSGRDGWTAEGGKKRERERGEGGEGSDHLKAPRVAEPVPLKAHAKRKEEEHGGGGEGGPKQASDARGGEGARKGEGEAQHRECGEGERAGGHPEVAGRHAAGSGGDGDGGFASAVRGGGGAGLGDWVLAKERTMLGAIEAEGPSAAKRALAFLEVGTPACAQLCSLSPKESLSVCLDPGDVLAQELHSFFAFR